MVLPIVRPLPRWRPATFGASPTGERLQRIMRSPQYVDGALRNGLPTAVIKPGSNARVAYVQLTGWRRRQPGIRIPVYPFRAADYARAPASGLRLTWLGHASVLAEVDGRRVLFDPVWSARCSPFTFVGPSRFHPVPISLAVLPPVDVVVISHDHYDHLDMPTVRTLARSTSARFAVPLGIGAHLQHWGVPEERITELDWHETAQVAGLSVTATPARHHCGRSLRRDRTVLWSSWVVAGESHRVFHCGDSGYFPGLATIGAQYGPFDATMIPVGAYHEYWPDVHMTPEQAIHAHRDLDGVAMLPIHWGTYNLAPHPWAEPIERTVGAAREARVTLLTPRPGEPIEPVDCGLPVANTPWWRPEHAAPQPSRGAIEVASARSDQLEHPAAQVGEPGVGLGPHLVSGSRQVNRDNLPHLAR